MAAVRGAREAEVRAARSAEVARFNAENERQRQQDRKRALAAGGNVAAQARWEEAWERSPGLCQWETDDGYRTCMRRAASSGDVYCTVHNRQLEREARIS
jgi:hypothetical protein